MSHSIYKLLNNLFPGILLFFLVVSAVPLQADSGPYSSSPCCSIPHDTYIDCDDLPWNFDPTNIWQLAYHFGSPGYSSHYGCHNYAWTELSPIVDLNTCEVGTITRRFQTYDYSGWGSVNTITCQQVITINGSHNYEIRFPADEVAYCVDPEPEDILYHEIGCDLLAVSTTDQVFNTGSAACYKIFRTYRVINWCEYDGISAPVVIGRDEDCDGVPGDEAVWLLRRPSGQVYIDRNNNENDHNPSYAEIDPWCTHTGNGGYWRSFSVGPNYNSYSGYGGYGDHSGYGNNGYGDHHVSTSGGFWQYTQHIKVTDNILPQVHVTPPSAFCSYSNATCEGSVDIPFTVVEECSEVLDIKVFFFPNRVPVPLTYHNNIATTALSGSFPNYRLTGSYPIGEHAFKVLVSDGCGNTSAKLIPFKVVDCLAPSPTCIVSLSSTYMPVIPAEDVDGDGDLDHFMMELWATDFIASPAIDCSGPVTYSVNRLGDTPNINDRNIIFTCDDGNEVPVEVYAWDSAYNPHRVQPNGHHGGPNYSFCLTFITFTAGDCAPLVDPPLIDTTHVDDPVVDTDSTVTGYIAGFIFTEMDSALMEAEVRLDGMMEDTMMTEDDGLFEFADLPMSSEYRITPEKDGDDMNGITSNDLVILAMHIFGLDTLDSPYQLIAADVDSSGTIDTDDYRELRKLVLQEDSLLRHNTSWRFVDAAFQFPNPANPWLTEFPEIITMQEEHERPDSLEFVAIKIGDLDFSAVTVPREEGEDELENRSINNPLVLQAQDQYIKAGDEVRLTLQADDLADYLRGQFTLNVDPNALLFHSQLDQLAETGDMATAAIDADQLNMLWWDTAPDDKATPLTLVFTALQEGQLRDFIRLEVGEGIDQTGTPHRLELQFIEQQLAADAVVLLQNNPNPFREETIIGYYLPQESNISLRIYDAKGNLLQQMNATQGQGRHQWRLNANDLPAAGLLYYTLTTEQQTLTKRMIRVK